MCRGVSAKRSEALTNPSISRFRSRDAEENAAVTVEPDAVNDEMTFGYRFRGDIDDDRVDRIARLLVNRVLESLKESRKDRFGKEVSHFEIYFYQTTLLLI